MVGEEDVWKRDYAGVVFSAGKRTVVLEWQPTVDGLWEFIQTTRELRELPREGTRPKGFDTWAARALEDPGPDPLWAVVEGFIGDPSVKAAGWPTAVLISAGMWTARRPAKLELLQGGGTP